MMPNSAFAATASMPSIEQRSTSARVWTRHHWAVAIACGSFFAVTNFAQTAAITSGFGGAARLLVFATAFVTVYNLIAVILRLAWRLPAFLDRDGALNLPAVAAHGTTLVAAGLAQLYAISVLTALAREPGNATTAIGFYFEEILISCTPVWILVYVLFSAILRILPQPSPVSAGLTSSHAQRIEYRDGGATKYVDIQSITHIVAQDNYAQVELETGAIMMRKSIAALEEALPSGKFLRTHRGAIARACLIREIRRAPSGAYVAMLEDGETVPVSRRRLSAVREALASTTISA